MCGSTYSVCKVEAKAEAAYYGTFVTTLRRDLCAYLVVDLQNLGAERMEWSTNSPDLNPFEHLWDQLRRAVRARVKKTTTLINP